MRRRRWIPILWPFAVVIGFFVWARFERDRQLMKSMGPYSGETPMYADGGDSVTLTDEYRPEDAAAPPVEMSRGVRWMPKQPVPSHSFSDGAIPLPLDHDRRSSPRHRRGHRSHGGG